MSNSIQASKTRPKSVARSWLRLEGVSFTILPFEERDSVLRDFTALLSTVKRGVLLARRVGYEYKYSDYSFSVTDTEFYLKAPAGSQVVYFNPRPGEPSRPRAVRMIETARRRRLTSASQGVEEARSFILAMIERKLGFAGAPERSASRGCCYRTALLKQGGGEG